MADLLPALTEDQIWLETARDAYSKSTTFVDNNYMLTYFFNIWQ